MSRKATLALGVASVLPALAFVLFAVSGFSFPLPGTGLPASAIAFGSTMLLGFGLVVFYLLHAIRNGSFTTQERMLWVVLLAVFGMASMPVYWYAQFWKASKHGALRKDAV